MRSFTLTMRAIGCLPLLALIGTDHAGAESLPREEVRILVLKQTMPGDVEGWIARQRELQTRPDIKPDLFAMLDEALEKQDWELIGPPLAALRLRSDLTPDELARLVKPLEDYSSNPAPPDMLTKSFVGSALPVLRHYPSEAHEKLALSYLAKNDSSIRESAIDTLAAIGTEQSLPALRELREKLRPAPGNKNRYYDAVVEAVAKIEDRVLTPAKLSNSSPSAGSFPKKKASEANAPKRELNTTITWAVGAVLIMAVLGLLWVLLKRR